MKDINNKVILEEEIHSCACSDNKSMCKNTAECQCDTEKKEDHMFITLTTDDGSDLKCQVLGTFDDGVDATYIALMPVGDDTVYLYGFEQESDEPILRKIETDKEYERASALFLELSE